MNVFSYFGIAMMVIGAGLGVGGLFTGPIGRLTLWSIAAGVFFTGIIFFVVGRQYSSGFRTGMGFGRQMNGLPGQATVLGMRETGITLSGFGAGPEAAMLGFDLLVQLPAQAGGQLVVHRFSSPKGSRGSSDLGARERRAASARLAWDLTVPTEMPRASAVSASDSSS